MSTWMRGFVWILAFAIAIAAARSAAVNAFSERMPSRALSLQSSAPVALMSIVGKEISNAGLNAPPSPNWGNSAMVSLQSQPLNAPALRTIALLRQAEGKPKEALLLMRLSERVSRRDILTQLWLMQEAVQRDDIPTAIGHIDTALTTRVEIGETVFPVLRDALADPRIVAEFAKLVRQDRIWLRAFLSFANEDARNPERIVKGVRLAGGLPAAIDYREFETDLVWALSKAGKIEEIPPFLADLKRASSKDLADGRMTQKTIDPRLGPFAWTSSADQDVSSSISDAGEVSFRAAPMRTGMVLQRLMALGTADYNLRAQIVVETPESVPSIDVEAACATRDRSSLLRHRIKNPRTATLFQENFRVPADCPIQIIRFVATGADTGSESEATLSKISVKSSR